MYQHQYGHEGESVHDHLHELCKEQNRLDGCSYKYFKYTYEAQQC
jgi:hypothetical protein